MHKMRKGWVLAAAAASVFLVGFSAPMAGQGHVQGEAPTKSELQQIVDEEGIIPEQAIRLRIIANSDDPADQKLKRDVRDEIIKAVAEEVRGVEDEAAARDKIRAAVPQMNKIAEQVILSKGYAYDVKTDFGLVPFPTKLYGDKVYPAGDYEALRIQIGAAGGQNWWCVLFPPLCFVDMANGDAVAQAKDMEGQKPGEKADEQKSEQKSDAITTVSVKNADNGGQQEVEVRSAFLDKIVGFFHNLFA
jgi:stage II sporulation protein R